LIPIAIDQAWTRRRSEYRDHRRPRVTIVKAHRNKAERAALAAPAWEAGKVVHVGPARRWVPLERQQTTYDPNRPHDRQQADRMDAAVWAMLQLLGDGTDSTRVQALTDAEGMARVLAEMRARQGMARRRR
jgi:phage terminase large subunit-like protein